jgi:hypothetical protein
MVSNVAKGQVKGEGSNPRRRRRHGIRHELGRAERLLKKRRSAGDSSSARRGSRCARDRGRVQRLLKKRWSAGDSSYTRRAPHAIDLSAGRSWCA